MSPTRTPTPEFPDVNIYYARVRGRKIERVGGEQIDSLDDPISPAEGNLVYDGVEQAWVHDVAAELLGRPVIVFATSPRPPITATTTRAGQARPGTSPDHAGGGTFREDRGSPTTRAA